MSKWNKYKDNRKQWKLNNPEKAKQYRLNEKCAKYKITYEDYCQLLIDQKGVCAICSNPETRVDHRTKKITTLAIDHNHETGKVRGLLCGNCNTALGLLQDCSETLLSAYKYLTK